MMREGGEVHKNKTNQIIEMYYKRGTRGALEK